MKRERERRRGPATMFLVLGAALLTAALATGCQQTIDQATRDAADAKRAAVEPRLEQFKAEHPEAAGDVQAILDGWATRAERGTYELVEPLIRQYVAEHPEDLDATERVMKSWRRRLDAGGGFPPDPGR